MRGGPISQTVASFVVDAHPGLFVARVGCPRAPSAWPVSARALPFPLPLQLQLESLKHYCPAKALGIRSRIRIRECQECQTILRPARGEDDDDKVELVKEGKKVFFRGVAGTGKSLLVKCIKRVFATLRPCRWAVVAPTGTAACNVGGVTLRSLGGVGVP